MTYLLDTHVWLWWVLGESDLPKHFREAIESPDNDVFVSVVSLWEAIIKSTTGKLLLPKNAVQYSLNEGIEMLPLDLKHIELLASLPRHHGDPFDRALVAQCVAQRVIFMTVDRIMPKYAADSSLQLFS